MPNMTPETNHMFKICSFGIPCYNSAADMDRCITSILEGSGYAPDVEIIIVDDGSVDETPAKADEWVRRYPGIIRAVHQENGGHGTAVLTGLKNATGVYYKVVDSDDWLDGAALATMLSCLRGFVERDTRVDLFISNYVYEKVHEGTHTTIDYRFAIPRKKIIGWNDVGYFRPDQHLLMHSLCYRTDVLRAGDLPLPPHTFYVDNIYAYVPLPRCKTLYYADIDLYLMAGNQTAKVSTEGIEQATGSLRVMAYGLAQEENEEGTAYTLSFKTNTDVNSAQINIIEKSTGTVVTTIYPEKGEGNTYSATVSVDDLAEDVAYTWEAEVSGDNITRLTAYKSVPFSAPYGVAIDNSTSSEYFGRIYVTNTAEGSVGEQTTATGLYAIEPDGNLEIGNVMTGGISWTGTKGQGPRKVAVAEDGRIFVCDYSTTNTGIYYIDPATFEGKPVFEGAVNDGNGSLTINGTYVAGRTTSIGVRGGGDETQLYAVDATASGLGWRKLINRYDIGSANVWTAAPSEAGYSSSYIGNENNSIVPVSTGYWAAQFRGQGSSSVANPTLFYYSDVLGGSAYDSSAIDDQASANGALAVDEKTGTVVQSYNNGVRVFHYSIRKSDNIPDVEVVFEKQLAEVGAEGNSFAFDYAGNLYTVSSDAQNLTIFGMPTSDNTCATPSSAEFSFGDSSVEELQQAKELMTPLLGENAGNIFAAALLLAGVSSTVTSGMAAGSISAGIFGESYHVKDSHSQIGIVASLGIALLLIFFIGDPFQGLLVSQMVLSLQLPFTVFLQVWLTSSPRVMGQYANTPLNRAVLYGIAIIVTLLNIYLLIAQ